MNEAIFQRVQLLLSQGRIDDAHKQISAFLEEDPTNEMGRYMLAYILFYKGKTKESQKIALHLQQDNPENTGYLSLLAEIHLKEEEFEFAEEKTTLLLEMEPDEVAHHNLKSRLKFAQRYYDRALEFANSALEIDPENIEALNQKTTIAGILGDKNIAGNTIKEALEIDPENPYTIANHGNQLLLQGNVDEALERLSEALRLNPTNGLARYAMQQALKSRFWPYKMFYKYIHAMARLTEKGSWGVIIGAYLVYRVILGTAESNETLAPFLFPIAYLLLGLFLLSWIINPLMNLYLLTNKYGRLLLDDDEIKMAKLTGLSLILALFMLACFLSFDWARCLYATVFFIAMMIPLGSFLTPYKEDSRKKLTYYTIGLFVFGALGIVTGKMLFFTIAYLGIFVYQFIANSLAIRSSSRRVE